MKKRAESAPALPRRVRLARITLAALLLVLAVPVLGHAQRNAVQGSIRGRVMDESTNSGIAGALVEFMDGRTRQRGSAVTDAEGNFILPSVPSGPFRLRASRIGFARIVTPYWRVLSGEALTVTVRMHPEAVVLAPLEINAVARSRSPVLASFYHRVERGIGGTYITREEIERRNPGLVSDLLRAVSGVELTQGFVTSVRALPGMGGGANGCPMQIWVDGVLATRGGPVELDALATPAVLEGIEIHRGLSTVPAEFLTPEARCGVIAIWTQRGG